MFANTPDAAPNQQAFDTHFDNGMKALDQGLNQEAKGHLRHAAQSLTAIIKRSPTGASAAKNTALLEKIVAIVERIKDRPDEVPVSVAQDTEIERRMGDAAKPSASGKYRGVEQYLRQESVEFSDIIGHEAAKAEFFSLLVLPVKHPNWCQEYGYKGGGGMLLIGSPGTGKSQIAQAAANEIGADFYKVDSAELTSKWLGESEKKVRDLFEGIRLRANETGKPAVLFLYDCDALVESAEGSESAAQRKIGSKIQIEMDEIAKANKAGGPPIVVVGATSYPWELSDAMRQRFTSAGAVYLGLPTIEDRERIFQAKSARFAAHLGDVDFAELARKTDGLSGDSIEKICDRVSAQAARASALKNERTTITQETFLGQAEQQAPSSTEESLLRLEQWREKYAAGPGK